MDVGKDFPISEYYRGHIVDAFTLSRSPTWWSAVLVIKDPKSNKNIFNIYQWQMTDDGWKVRKNFSFKKQKDLDTFANACKELAAKFPLE